MRDAETGDRFVRIVEHLIVRDNLEETCGKTTLSLTHRSISSDVVDDHERGWMFFLSRLHGALDE